MSTKDSADSAGGFDVDKSVTSVCDALRRTLPRTEFQMAYGSAVFRQAGYASADDASAQQPMVDFIVAVEDPVEWHRENMERNKHHYSFLRWIGPAAVARIQDAAAQVGRWGG